MPGRRVRVYSSSCRARWLLMGKPMVKQPGFGDPGLSSQLWVSADSMGSMAVFCWRPNTSEANSGQSRAQTAKLFVG